MARLRAWVRVALRMRASFWRRLGSRLLWEGCGGEEGDVRAGTEEEDHAVRDDKLVWN